uniref:G_PROTEIN_RECEP_F1_2 domain-containing protein n=1 Tax=Trichobilharzia regenti TaxID=157069 RepID=A0AA85K225_TRIRE|nr:unnamed protein product [Trichobilharzia regenti]
MRMSAHGCLTNTTGSIPLSNQELYSAANTAIQLNANLNSTDYSTLNISAINYFQINTLPLFKSSIGLYDNTESVFCSRYPSYKREFNLNRILQTYVQPFVIFFTIITNCLISIVLTHPTMRNSTNIILLGIAICDLLTVLLPTPVYLSLLTSNLFSENLTAFKGYIEFYLTTILPTVCHTSSIWLTVLLALQRFIYVHFPLKANRICLCQWRSVQWLIICTIIAGLLHQLPHMIVTRFEYALEYCMKSSVSINSSFSSQLSSVVKLSKPTTFIIDSEHISYILNKTTEEMNENVYITFLRINLLKCTPMSYTAFTCFLLFRVITVNLIPCIMLSILTTLLIMALRRFIQNRQKLLRIKNENHQILINKKDTNSQLLKRQDEDNEKDSGQQERNNYKEISLTDQLRTSVTGPKTTSAMMMRNVCKRVSDRNSSQQKSSSRVQSSTDPDSTSKMMLVILSIFLFTEIPITVCLCIYAFVTVSQTQPSAAFYQEYRIKSLLRTLYM